MDGQRQRSGNGRRRRRKSRSEPRAHVEPILIAARRPNSPLIATTESGRAVAAAGGRRGFSSPDSARGRKRAASATTPIEESANAAPADDAHAPNASDNGNGSANGTSRRERSARIVQITRGDTDGRERERQRLMDRLMASETRGAITRAADDYARAGFDFPAEQQVQLQLLEHFDEDRARGAIEVLARLLSHESPVKKPILEQRLRRLEEYADEPVTRSAAADLRRAIRA